MTARLIGLCSPAMFSGKTTVAQHLVEQHGFTRVAFATPLKMMTEGLLRGLGMPAAEIKARVYGDRKEDVIPELGITSRRFQQLGGTEFARKMISDTLWLDIAMGVAGRLLNAGQSVVIDDMRFPNEYEAIQAAGGECYRVMRPETRVTAAHASEGQLDLVAMPEIWNTATVADLHRAVDRAVFA